MFVAYPFPPPNSPPPPPEMHTHTNTEVENFGLEPRPPYEKVCLNVGLYLA